MAILLSEATAAQTRELTLSYKSTQNAQAARIAALVALWYQSRVDPRDPGSVETWLGLMVPRLISASDSSARAAANFFQAVRDSEARVGDGFRASPSLGAVNKGVRESLLTVGPYDYMNKLAAIEAADVSPQQADALLREAKEVTAGKVAAATVRHAQAGGRRTINENVRRDNLALGWVRVTSQAPCAFCAMLASRGIHYAPYKQDSFYATDARFEGSGDAKVHDSCGCSLKPVYSKSNDPMVDKTKEFAEMWDRWGAGGGDAALRFRRGYEHYRSTGDYLSWEQANEGLSTSKTFRR